MSFVISVIAGLATFNTIYMGDRIYETLEQKLTKQDQENFISLAGNVAE